MRRGMRAAEDVHRKKGEIEADEEEPEIPLGLRLVQHVARHLREPVVDGREQREDGAPIST